jgi:hypothetical protein
VILPTGDFTIFVLRVAVRVISYATPKILMIGCLLALLTIVTVYGNPAFASPSFFDFLFGGFRPAPQLAPPPPRQAPPASVTTRPPVGYSGGQYTFYCVRLCDGRYFPLHHNAKPICEALCPANKTEIFSGSEIAQATSADGSPYQKLANAFVYRERIVPGCTCNGHDELGIASMKIEDDPTLEPGDLIATKNRLVPFRTWRKEAKYTPIEKNSSPSPKRGAPIVTKKNVSITVRSQQRPSITNAKAPVEIPAQQW